MSRVIDPSRRTPKGFEETHQLWSPDGRRIAFNRTFKGDVHRGKTNAEYKRLYRAAQAKSGVYRRVGRGREAQAAHRFIARPAAEPR